MLNRDMRPAHDETRTQYRDLVARQAQALLDGDRAAFLENSALIPVVLESRDRALDAMLSSHLREVYRPVKPKRHLRSVK